jgi:hypothetical protein
VGNITTLRQSSGFEDCFWFTRRCCAAPQAQPLRPALGPHEAGVWLSRVVRRPQGSPTARRRGGGGGLQTPRGAAAPRRCAPSGRAGLLLQPEPASATGSLAVAGQAGWLTSAFRVSVAVLTKGARVVLHCAAGHPKGRTLHCTAVAGSPPQLVYRQGARGWRAAIADCPKPFGHGHGKALGLGHRTPRTGGLAWITGLGLITRAAEFLASEILAVPGVF